MEHRIDVALGASETMRNISGRSLSFLFFIKTPDANEFGAAEAAHNAAEESHLKI
jgi:hypothetical protein